MKRMKRVLWATALPAAILLSFFAPKSYAASNAFKLTGLGAGYSFVLKDVRYRESDRGYFGPTMRPCLALSLGLVSDGHFGIIFDGVLQFYDEVYHNLTDVGPRTTVNDSAALLNLGVSLEFSFFRDIKRSWNPYVSFGGFMIVPLNTEIHFIDGSYPPDYPRKGEKAGFKAAAGTRVRMTRSVYLNPRVVYYSGTSILSVQVGIDLVFPKKSPPDPDLTPRRKTSRWQLRN
jgi:hypothetical protein